MNSPAGNDQQPEPRESLLVKASRKNSAFHEPSLRRISRSRIRLLVCFWTLPVYVVAVWMLLSSGRNVDTIMWVYMGLYALFAVDMARRRCPRCSEQFFVKTILLNLRTHRCVHCELPLVPIDAPKES